MKRNEKHAPSLVVLAAGMGSRYNGLKQLDTFSPEGDTIVDFSIYDAIRAGFKKIVFIIRKNLLEDFKAAFEPKFKDKVEISYVFQELEDVPPEFINKHRTKPWGTGHALMLTEEVINENFAVVNADDFYGREAFESMAKYLKETSPESYNFSLVAYKLRNTVSDYGYVSRGQCEISPDGDLKDVTERTHIEKKENEILVKNAQEELEKIDPDTYVSMNFWGFTPKCFEFGKELFLDFLKENKGNPQAEFFIPTLVNEMLKSDQVNVKVLTTNEKWFGVTYPEDKAIVQDEIQELKKKNVYPEKLWK